MRTLIWKELRENAKWAALATVALLLAEFYALGLNTGGGGYDAAVTLCSSAFLLVTSFGSALVGAALGAVQILPELRRDQWASLLHRPLSRTGILLGKVAAGLVLYAISVGIPFGASVLYAITPGQFPSPVVPGMLIPGLSDLAFGVAFYFLAILLCLHRGAWWGSRGAIALSAVPLFVVHLGNGWPFLLPLSAAFLAAMAAWGAMISNGPMRSRPIAARMACVAIVYGGCYAFLLLGGFVISLAPGKLPPYFIDYQSFVVTRDGEVLVSATKSDGSGVQYRKPSGEAVTDKKYFENGSQEMFIRLEPLVFRMGADTDYLRSYANSYPRIATNYLQKALQDPDSKENWFYLTDRKVFVGYDRLSRRRVGSLDAQGFHKTGEPATHPFKFPLASSPWGSRDAPMYFGGPELHMFDFASRESVRLLDVPGQEVLGATATQDASETGPIIVALSGGLKFLNKQGAVLASLPYHYDMNRRGVLQVAANPARDRIYLEYSRIYWSRPENPLDNKIDLDVLNGKGELLESFSIEGNKPMAADDSWNARFFRWTSPPVLVLASSGYRHLVPAKLPSLDYRMYPMPSFVQAWSDVAILFLISGALAIGAFFLATRRGMTAALAARWACFIFLFSLPALMAFLVAADWPVRVRCPKCGRRRLVEAAFCGGCAETWGSPSENGAEIFDAEPAALAGKS